MKKFEMEDKKEKGQDEVPAVAPKISPINVLRFAFWILLVVGVGLLAVNQFLNFTYKAELLKSPCTLCAELNPGVQDCIDYLNNPVAIFWTKEGWINPFNESNKIKINISEVYP